MVENAKLWLKYSLLNIQLSKYTHIYIYIYKCIHTNIRPKRPNKYDLRETKKKIPSSSYPLVCFASPVALVSGTQLNECKCLTSSG